MTTDLLRQKIASFLEFHGFTVKRDGDMLAASQPQRQSLRVQVFPDGALFRIVFTPSAAAQRDRLGYLDFLNTANSQAAANRYYAEEDFSMAVESLLQNRGLE